MKTRIVALNGGLGNQMFQYAFAKMLETTKHCRIEFDIGDYKGNTERSLELQNYSIGEYVFRDHKIFNKVRLIFQRIPFVSWIAGTYKEKSFFVVDPRIMRCNYKFYFGYWQNKEYFSSIKGCICKGLTYKGDVSSRERQIANEIEKADSIAIHVRRGDYLRDKYSKIYYSLDERYYRRAIGRACRELSNRGVDKMKFYFFSDDISWCRDRFSDLEDAIFIDDSISSSANIDLFLMRKSRCQILANSTFSWWSAWLSDREDKIVIVPDKWYIDKKINEKAMKALIEDWWITEKV